MAEFTNVTVVKKANVYFNGKVSSRTVLFTDGTKKTLGIMLPGEYEFGTAEKEGMEILAGRLDVLLPGSPTWRSVKAGDSFEVPPQSKFKLKVAETTDYCCSYLKGLDGLERDWPRRRNPGGRSRGTLRGPG
jgi:uncharacterized protein YaiE (UPF0345 family)